jgi:hypothetical protein
MRRAANHAFCHNYDGSMYVGDFPHINGQDRSYPARNDKASEFFYKISPGRRPWIAAVDRAGAGLFRTSTSRLGGRKMFVWGRAPGGENWQDILTVPGHPYLEIQAGLAPTQSHRLAATDSDWDCAVDAYAAALDLMPERVELVTAMCRAGLRAGQHRRVLQTLATLPATMRERGEIVLIEGEAALMLGDEDRVRTILTMPITVTNLREGDTSMTSLWFRLNARRYLNEGCSIDRSELGRRLLHEYPPPQSIDYRASWHDVRF